MGALLPWWRSCLLPGQHYSLNGIFALGFLGYICFPKYFRAVRKEQA